VKYYSNTHRTADTLSCYTCTIKVDAASTHWCCIEKCTYRK